MRRAARTDANHAEILQALRDAGCSVFDCSGLGGGFPDLCVGIGGRTVLLEIKDGKKPLSRRQLTDAQLTFFGEWKGGPLCIVCDVDSALRAARVAG